MGKLPPEAPNVILARMGRHALSGALCVCRARGTACGTCVHPHAQHPVAQAGVLTTMAFFSPASASVLKGYEIRGLLATGSSALTVLVVSG